MSDFVDAPYQGINLPNGYDELGNPIKYGISGGYQMKTPREILEELSKSAQCADYTNDDGDFCLDCFQERIDQTLSALREVVLGKKKEAKYIDSPEAIRFNNEQYLKTEGYNQALQDIANLFGGEK